MTAPEAGHGQGDYLLLTVMVTLVSSHEKAGITPFNNTEMAQVTCLKTLGIAHQHVPTLGGGPHEPTTHQRLPSGHPACPTPQWLLTLDNDLLVHAGHLGRGLNESMEAVGMQWLRCPWAMLPRLAWIPSSDS